MEKTQNAVFGFLWREALAQLLEYQCARELAVLGFLPALEFHPGSGKALDTWTFPPGPPCALLPGACYCSYDCPHLKKDGIEPLQSDLPALTQPVAELGFELGSQKSSLGLSPFCHAACFPAPSVISG